MKKVKFLNLDKYNDKVASVLDKKYILLYYYLMDRKNIDSLQETIEELELIQRGEKTFEEIYTFNIVDISFSAGEFECDKEIAYFISNHPEQEASFEMPLKELIEILTSWENFLKNT